MASDLVKWAATRGGFPSGKWTKARLQEMNARYDEIKALRSEVLEAALYVESRLDEVLCDAFVGAEQSARARLLGNVLQAEFCSFFQKWRMLRNLLKEDSPWVSAVRKIERAPPIDALHRVIAFRNRFAHGQLHVNGDEMNVYITFIEGGRKTELVTADDVRSMLMEAREVDGWLERAQGAAIGDYW